MWLLRRELAEELTRNSKLHGSNLELAIPKESRDAFYASFGASHSALSAGPNLPRNAAVAGDALEIRVEGILTAKPDIFAWFFGGGNCTYESIQQALAYAAADPTIKKIVWKIASGGGRVTGLFETLAAIEAMTKPMTVLSSEACSAAYAIAALAAKNGKIESTTPASEFGCLGVAIDFCFENDETCFSITSTEAPDKRPDPKTPEGQAVIRAELDAVHQLFVEAIARGRKTTVKDVNANFGRGAVYLAGKAKSLNMIDKVGKVVSADPPVDTSEECDEEERRECARVSQETTQAVAVVPPQQEPPAAPQAKPQSSAGAEQPTTRKESRMDLATLQAQHPELYKQITESAKAEGATEGQAKERKRVAALLKMGTKCGAMDVALKAVESGASVQDDDVFTDFQTAAMNRAAQTNRQQDNAAVDSALSGVAASAASSSEPKDLGDAVIAAIDAQAGQIHA